MVRSWRAADVGGEPSPGPEESADSFDVVARGFTGHHNAQSLPPLNMIPIVFQGFRQRGDQGRELLGFGNRNRGLAEQGFGIWNVLHGILLLQFLFDRVFLEDCFSQVCAIYS